MKTYSVDLREKIVAAVRRGMSKAQAARTFGGGAKRCSKKAVTNVRLPRMRLSGNSVSEKTS